MAEAAAPAAAAAARAHGLVAERKGGTADEALAFGHTLRGAPVAPAGFLALGGLWATWTAGCFAPLVVAALLQYGHDALALAACALVALDFAVPTRESPAFVRFWLLASGWFEGGATLWLEPGAARADLSAKTVIAMHPHGVFCYGFQLNGAARIRCGATSAVALPTELHEWDAQTTGVVEPLLHQLPFIRRWLAALGCAEPASRKRVQQIMRRGASFGILPGGSDEIVMADRGRERIYIRKRRGFVKYALQHGYRIVPGYTFGEADLYRNLFDAPSLRLKLLNATKMPLFLVFGCWWCPWLPRRDVPLNTVYAAPVELPHLPDPTPRDVEEHHRRYVDAVAALFDRHKARFGYGDRVLEVY